MSKKVLLILVFTLFSLILMSCSGNNSISEDDSVQVYQQDATKMDTYMNIKAYGPNAKTAVQEAYKRVDEIEQMASANIETSDVSKINNAAGKEYVKVHPEVIKMIKTAVQYSKLSGGAFDITVGPLIKLWGIGTKNERVPSDSEIKAILPLAGYDKISINESDNSVMLQKQGMSIDLGGIAKGFTADEILKIFNKYNIKKGLINLGGSSICTLGQNDKGQPWSVGIQDPRGENNQDIFGIMRLSDKALSTSGDYERYFIQDGKRYHHILNPYTGYPAESGVIADSVVIDGSVPDKAMLADILTKIVFVLGPEKGMKILENIPKVDCVAVTPDYKVYTTPGIKDNIQIIKEEYKLEGNIN